MEIYKLLLGILAVWRVTHLFYAEDGPWEIFARIRRLAGSGFFGALLDCFYCSSLWVAIPAALVLGAGWQERIFLWLALSAGAIVLERITNREPGAPPALYFEDKEEDHVLLRQEQNAVQQRNERQPSDVAADDQRP